MQLSGKASLRKYNLKQKKRSCSPVKKVGERTFQRIAACVKSPRLNKGRNFKRALTAATTAPKRREVTKREGRRRPHQGLVSHVQGFYLKCNESLRRGLGGEVTRANFCFKTIVLAVVWRISWKGARGEAGCLMRRLLKILEVAHVEEGGGGTT